MSFTAPHKSIPSPAGEPTAEPAQEHRVSFMPAGGLLFAFCTCGWIDCAPDQETLSRRAVGHDLRQVAP